MNSDIAEDKRLYNTCELIEPLSSSPIMVLSKHIKRLLKLISGWFLVFLGIIGLFLPILQGIALIIAGLAVLASEYEWARHWMEKLKSKIKSRPKVGQK